MGKISVVEDDDCFELSSEDIEGIESIATSLKELLLRDFEELLNKFEKKIDNF